MEGARWGREDEVRGGGWRVGEEGVEVGGIGREAAEVRIIW